MGDNIGDIISKKIKEIGIVNLIVILFFIIALIYFIFFSISYYFNKIFGNNTETEIIYDYENEANYSVETEDENYKTKLVTSYSNFFNIDDVLKSVFMHMANNQYDEIFSVFSERYKARFSNKEDAIVKMTSFYNNNLNYETIYNKISNLVEVYNVENSNIYICYFKNKDNELKRIVLNVDFAESIYYIDYIEL